MVKKINISVCVPEHSWPTNYIGSIPELKYAEQLVEGYLQHSFKRKRILILNKEKVYCIKIELENLRNEFKKKMETSL